MFSDSFTAIMVLVILNFAGMIFVFLYLLRALDEHSRTLHEVYEHMEMRLMDLQQTMGDLARNAMRQTSQGVENSSVLNEGADLQEILEQRLSHLEKHSSTASLHLDVMADESENNPLSTDRATRPAADGTIEFPKKHRTY